MAAKNYAGFNYNIGAQYAAPPAGTTAAGYSASPVQAPYPVVTNPNYTNEYQTAAAYTGTAAPLNSGTSVYGYDYSQSYYQQASANYNSAPPTPTVSKTHYSSPPVKNLNLNTNKSGGKKMNGSGKHTGPPLPPGPPPSVGYVNYDAIYNAASLYVQQQQQAGKINNTGYGSHWSSFRGGRRSGGGHGANRNGDSAKGRLQYCEVCKISCAGPQSYREHLEGQKHKKREASSKLQATALATAHNKGNNQHCELCDVTCTGNDAYAAHVRGTKHQRVLKLHQKLGKPIPTDEPKKIEFITEGSKESEEATEANASTKATTAADNADDQYSHIKPVGGEYIEEIKDNDGKMISFNCKLCECKFNDPNAKEMHTKGRRHRLQYKRKVQPDLVVDFKPTTRQRYLADARAQRALLHSQRVANRGYYQENDGGMFWDDQQRGGQYGCNEYGSWLPRGFIGPQRGGYGGGRAGCNGPPPPFYGMMSGGPGARRPESLDDSHAITRHAEIYPKEDELVIIQRIVSHTERALKFVSDSLADNPDDDAPDIKKENPEAAQIKDGRDSQIFSFQKEAEANNARILKGVMRVGFLAKGLLLQGDNNVELVVLCAEKPTVGLLKRVAAELPNKLKEVVGEPNTVAYEVTTHLAEAAIYVTDGSVTVTIFLTSPLLREIDEGNSAAGANKDVSGDATLLPLEPCLKALAELRRAKWFQARATGLPSCVMTIRLLRDLCNRVQSWQALPQWPMELLVEKVISSAGFPLSPGECLRRIMESLSTGFIINGPGLADPCEKEPQDCLIELSKQQREDLTVAAQQFLRYIAFRQIYKVLGMDQLPPTKYSGRPWQFNRKRLRSTGNSGMSGDKKDDTDEKATEVKVAKI